MIKFKSLTSLFVILAYSLGFVNAQNWPGWRGPNGDGTSTETKIPVKWDTITNVVWKTTIPGKGYASPIIWEGKLFTATAIPETQERLLVCFDTKNGNLLWKSTVLKTIPEVKHDDNSYASGTPATDGNSIFVSFLDGVSVVVAAYDFSGKQLWLERPGTFDCVQGYSCSPIIFKDKVIINGDSEGDAFVAALSKVDGHTIWKISHPRKFMSYSTPIIREIAGRFQMFFCGNQEMASYNPEDGTKNWFVNGPSEEFCSSPVYSEKLGLMFASSCYPQRHLLAIKPDGAGDVSNTHISWRSTNGACFVPSPIVAGDYLLSTMTNGSVYCIEASSGKIFWKENLGKQYASAVYANGMVYMPNDAGTVTVIKPGPKFEVISRNSIGETLFASPAISNGRIYLRGDKHLYCIGEK
ncbi:MAG: PQQ-binding-like beta-propeller repeat protein [Mariniphaga sp.]